MKSKKPAISKKDTISKRPLMSDKLTQLSTMADFYAHVSRNVIPELYVKRIIKKIKSESSKLLNDLGVTLAIHTDRYIGDGDLKTMLTTIGNNVNFEIFIKNNKNHTYTDIGFNVYTKDEVLLKLKKDWSIHTDSGRSVFIFEFKSFEDLDKVFGLSLLSNGKKLSLLKEVALFEDMICEEGVVLPDYKTIKEGVDLFFSTTARNKSYDLQDISV